MPTPRTEDGSPAPSPASTREPTPGESATTQPGIAHSAAIISAGDPILRAPAAVVGPELMGTRELNQLVEAMVAAMRAAPGVGLAAPQLGVGLRVIVLEDKPELMGHLSAAELEVRKRVTIPLLVLVNPVLKFEEEGRVTFFEGCLSVPGYTALVARAKTVTVTGFAPDGELTKVRATGWPARILQHECDHLDGTLYVDRMISRSLCTGEQARLRWSGRSLEEITEALHLR